ncbi:hypothetical protein MNBD_IGNAVI01-2339, partial [hydrothermal vent metagenome]
MRKLIIILCLLSVSTFAQENKFELSGNLYQDILISSNNYDFNSKDSINIVAKKRVPLLAA